jgi:hypothetical protein
VLVAFIILMTWASAAGASEADGSGGVDATGRSVRPIVFPVDGDVTYTDSWLDPRGGGRSHLGVDMMGVRLMPLLAARDSCVTTLDYGGPGGSNYLVLTDAEGWEYRYIHINNDSPGTDDGQNPPAWAFADGLRQGDCVAAGTHVSFLGDSGNAEGATPHLHFEIRRPDGIWINPYWSVQAAEMAGGNGITDDMSARGIADRELSLEMPVRGEQCGPSVVPEGTPSAASAHGYWLLDRSGRVHAFGGAEHHGDLGDVESAEPLFAAAIESTATGEGYWIVDTSGGVHPYGDAASLGDMVGVELDGPVRRIEAHPGGAGYWLVASDGGVFTFGSAAFHGSTGGIDLVAPVISMTATTTGSGYWLVAADGGVFTFGDAAFHGSTGGMDLAAPVIDMTVHPNGDAYWLYAADGGVFTFGRAGFHGSAPGLGRCDLAPSVAMRVTRSGQGYWLATSEGDVLTFGDAAWYGDRPLMPPDEMVIDMAVRYEPPAPPEGASP